MNHLPLPQEPQQPRSPHVGAGEFSAMVPRYGILIKRLYRFCFELGVLFAGVLRIRVLLFGVYTRAPDFRKLQYMLFVKGAI